jgi:dicarboxylate transporter 10
VIYKEKGIAHGLYAGVGATIVRAAFLTSAQLGSYDFIKNDILVKRFSFRKDKNRTHLTASMLASLIATTAANPPDVVKTRAMNDHDRSVGGSLCHLKNILKTEGP